jgi:hypothetical protein
MRRGNPPDDEFHRLMAAWGGPPAAQQSENDRKQPNKTAQIEALGERLTATYRISCERRAIGCEQTREVPSNQVPTAEEAAGALYREGWRYVRRNSQHIISCSNCDYSDHGLRR